MDKSELSHRLSRISTCWSLVAQAHRGSQDRVTLAQHQLLERYCGAIYRYLLGALRDADAADEVAQEFAVCFVRGDFKQADPDRGRFRDFVKTVLFHLIVNYQRQRQKRARMGPLHPDAPEPFTPPEVFTSDREFLDRWREELLDRTWEALAEVEKPTGQPYYQALRFRSEHPDTPSAEMAEQLSALLKRPITSAGARQLLHRSRERFGDLLIDEVARSLQTTAEDRIEQELIDLGLLVHCRPALDRRQRKKSASNG
jgi:RNA polymerase sigma-70 factor (ECF subfamily)